MHQTPLVSIIIPVRSVNSYLKECLSQIGKLTYPTTEVFVFCDQKNGMPKMNRVQYIQTGPIGPAQKRDLAIKYAHGQIFAFIDDDAYPSSDWLTSAVAHFTNMQIAAVGGPGITPPKVDWTEAASGWVSASPIGAGPYTYRFLPGKQQYVEDYPSMNLLVRASEFSAIGGFDSHYYPGEDTKLCLDLIHRGKKILYEPKAIVYHHRRPLWRAHLKQNGNFGIHRGFFARVLPKTSAKLIYFLPTLMVLNVATLLTSLALFPSLSLLIVLPLLFYAIALLANAVWIGLSSKSLLQAIISIASVFVTHLWYGLRFVQGYLFTNHLAQ